MLATTPVPTALNVLMAAVIAQRPPSFIITNYAYSGLSNNRAGWNETCRLEKFANFEKFKIVFVCRMKIRCF